METHAAERWLYERLAGDVALTAVVGTRIYNGLRSPSAPLPCVVFQLQAAGPDLMVVGAVRVWANLVYVVRGIVEGRSYTGEAKIIADRIDALLHAQQGSNADGAVWECVRERPFALVETTEAGREFRHVGGVYRVRAR